MMNEVLMQRIKEKGFKITNQRLCVIDVLQESQGNHLTAEEIYDQVKRKNPEIGLATVYRTIQLLFDLKIIDKLNLNDGIVRYELGNMDDSHHHHHLICEKCGKVIEVKDDLLENIESQIESDYAFQITNHILKFYGICEDCK